MRKLVISGVVASLLLPVLASAATAADLQAQAQALLDQVNKLQQQIGGGGSGPSSSGGGGCLAISRTLKKGSSGADVTALQQFLAQDPSIYPEGTVSGYYGALTQAAVQRWQAANGIVSSGSPSTTGYGVVGPKTLAAMGGSCGGGSSAGPTVGGYIQVTPISGNASLNVTVQAVVNTVSSCSAATYSLDFGDGSQVQHIPVAANTCQSVTQTYSHVYQYAGTYQIKLAAGTHETSATVTVYGASAPGSQQGMPGQSVNSIVPGGQTQSQYQAQQQTLAAGTFNSNVTSGGAPLTVTFTGGAPGRNTNGGSDYLTFGDGMTTSISIPASAAETQGYSVSHTYNSPGTYTAVLYNSGSSGQGQPAIGVITITVSGYTTGTGAYGIVSVTPSANGDPSTVSAVMTVPNCGAYQIDWGDGTPVSTITTSCPANASGPQQITLTHTYTSSFAYTIKLKDGNGNVQKTAGITIN